VRLVKKRYLLIPQIKCILQPPWEHMLDSTVAGIQMDSTKKAMISIKWMSLEYVEQFLGHRITGVGSTRFVAHSSKLLFDAYHSLPP
jgi:hypothetical protein